MKHKIEKNLIFFNHNKTFTNSNSKRNFENSNRKYRNSNYKIKQRNSEQLPTYTQDIQIKDRNYNDYIDNNSNKLINHNEKFNKNERKSFIYPSYLLNFKFNEIPSKYSFQMSKENLSSFQLNKKPYLNLDSIKPQFQQDFDDNTKQEKIDNLNLNYQKDSNYYRYSQKYFKNKGSLEEIEGKNNSKKNNLIIPQNYSVSKGSENLSNRLILKDLNEENKPYLGYIIKNKTEHYNETFSLSKNNIRKFVILDDINELSKSNDQKILEFTKEENQSYSKQKSDGNMKLKSLDSSKNTTNNYFKINKIYPINSKSIIIPGENPSNLNLLNHREEFTNLNISNQNDYFEPASFWIFSLVSPLLKEIIFNKKENLDFLDYNLSEDLKLSRLQNLWIIINKIIKILLNNINLENIPQIIINTTKMMLNKESPNIELEEILSSKFIKIRWAIFLAIILKVLILDVLFSFQKYLTSQLSKIDQMNLEILGIALFILISNVTNNMLGEEIILKNQNFINKNWIKEKRTEYELEKIAKYYEKILEIKDFIQKIRSIFSKI